jgi:hypothetical protein
VVHGRVTQPFAGALSTQSELSGQAAPLVQCTGVHPASPDPAPGTHSKPSSHGAPPGSSQRFVTQRPSVHVLVLPQLVSVHTGTQTEPPQPST